MEDWEPYPDNRRELIFSGSELAKIAKNPFRPVALAMLSPRYELDMHCAAGMVGYGRLAAVKNGTAIHRLQVFPLSRAVCCLWVSALHWHTQENKF